MVGNRQCFGRRPNGELCQNKIASDKREFCDRCDSEIFHTAPVKNRWQEEPELDKPNTYVPEPVEVPFNSDLEIEIDS